MLEKETKIFDDQLGEFLKTHEEQFVLIKDDTVEFFPTEEGAIEYGFRQFGVTSRFLVRQVVKEQLKVNIPSFSIGLPFTG